ncbi:flavodoxin family protein [Desulfovibrio sp. JC010]|uniref:flavodoxin family protein n=1 Tax=Desulfovibrio sp. JC010 TaxID=2593641 RepID=UPI0013D45F3E|nr:flavodoxin family protein [Desulfovibrio sp. JC010]NDV25273.1 flavodoxin family protein [Desulfovibrio sp. JC010]
MKVIAINGSPRKGGNTETMLKKVLEPLEAAGWETELYQLGGKKIRGCMACMKCWENKDNKCVVDNDKFNEVYEKMVEADAIVIGSPTYFTDVTAEIKALIDRSGFVALANDRQFAGKIGGAVVAVRRGGATHVFDTINHLFQINGMIIPGATYWNMGYGLNKGEVAEDAEGMANMLNLGQSIDWLGKAIKPHMDSFPKVGDQYGEG